MLLQTNSYVVPKEKRAEHARLVARFRQTLARLGCDHFETFEQVGANWSGGETSGRFVQLMRFRDRKHHQQVQAAERSDPAAQQLIREFCELINFAYQQQQGLFAVGYYTSVLAVGPSHVPVAPSQPAEVPERVEPPEQAPSAARPDAVARSGASPASDNGQEISAPEAKDVPDPMQPRPLSSADSSIHTA